MAPVPAPARAAAASLVRLVELAGLGERLDQLRSDREDAGFAHTLGLRVHPDLAQVRHCVHRIVLEQGGERQCPQPFEPVPATAALLRTRDRLLRPARSLAGAPRPASSSARQRSYLGRNISSRSDDCAHSSSSAAAPPTRRHAGAARTCAVAPAHRTRARRARRPPPSARSRRAGGGQLAAPDQALPGDALGGPGEIGRSVGHLPVAAALLVNRAPGDGADPRQP